MPRVQDVSFRHLALLLALVGALHGLIYVPLVQTNEVTDSSTYVAAADAILDGGYSTPHKAGFYYVHPLGFFDLTGYKFDSSVWAAPERQAFRPPGYPLFLALFGSGDDGASQAAALVGQAVLFGLGTWLLALVVLRWWGPAPALAAAALYALDPWSKRYVALLLSEALAAFVAVAGAYAFTRAWQERSVRWWAATGALAASLALVRSVFLLGVPLVVIAAVLRSTPAGGRLRAALATAAAAALFLTPWFVWTTAVTGRTVMADWGEGYNLLWAAHGEGYGRTASEVQESVPFRRDLASVHSLAPSTAQLQKDPEAHPRYLARADARLRGEARSLYVERLQDEPLRVSWEVVYRAHFLWNAHLDWYQPGGTALRGLQALDWALIVLALAGIAVALARGGPARGVAVFLLVYTLVLAAHHVEARFAIPLRGFFLAFAGLAIVRLVPAARALVARRG